MTDLHDEANGVRWIEPSPPTDAELEAAIETFLTLLAALLGEILEKEHDQ